MGLKTIDDFRRRLEAEVKNSQVAECAYASIHRPTRNLAIFGAGFGMGVACLVLLLVAWVAFASYPPGPSVVISGIVFFVGFFIGASLVNRATSENECLVGFAGDRFAVLFDPQRKARLETYPLSQVSAAQSSFEGMQLRLPSRSLTLRFVNFPGNREQRDRIIGKLSGRATTS